MDFSWLFELNTWIGFATLLVLEIVLGIDNLVFVAIIANKVKPSVRDKTRIMGLALAVILRLLMLSLMAYMISLTTPLFSIAGHDFSIKDVIIFLGGLFLIYKATTELHERLEGKINYANEFSSSIYISMGLAVVQILILDIIFSLDSVITAVHMVDHITVAMAAVVVAMAAMIWASKPLTEFVDKHPTIVMLCLGFLLMIGFSLIAEGFHFAIPKGYLYAAIGFSILIEVFNQIAQKNRKAHHFSDSSWRKRTADSVLGMMGMREDVIAKANKHGEKIKDDSVFEDNEKNMIRSVLTLAERSITAVMTPRRDIARLDISQSMEEKKLQISNTPFSRLIVVGEAGIEDPLGFVAKKDILTQLLTDDSLDLNSVLRQPLIIPETATVLSALELFRKNSADLALVVDEFGAILGMVTMKDMIESIAGDFPEEYELADAPAMQTISDESFTVNASFEFNMVASQLHIPPLPPLEESRDFHTVGGFMMEEMGTIPNIGDYIDYYGWRFEVVGKVAQRLLRIKISRLAEVE